MQHPVCTDASFQTTNPANLAKKVNLNPAIVTPAILFIIIYTWTGITLMPLRRALLRGTPLDQDCIAPPIFGVLFVLALWWAAHMYLSKQSDPYSMLELRFLPHFIAFATAASYVRQFALIWRYRGSERFRPIQPSYLSDKQRPKHGAPAQIIQFPGPNNPPGARKRA